VTDKVKEKMGLPTAGMLQSFYGWWKVYKKEASDGELIGAYDKNWWLNDGACEFNLFMKWLLHLINKDRAKKETKDTLKGKE